MSLVSMNTDNVELVLFHSAVILLSSDLTGLISLSENNYLQQFIRITSNRCITIDICSNLIHN